MHRAALISPRPSRGPAALAVVAAVVAAHAWLLLDRAAPRPAALRPAQAVLQVRQLVLPAVRQAAPDVATRPAAPTVAATMSPRPVPAVPRRAPRGSPPPGAAPPPDAAAAATAAAADITHAAATGADATVDADPHPPDPAVALPAYAARLPPPATLRFALRRGDAAGQAELHWLPAGDRYRLTLASAVPGRPAQGSASEGQIDAGGVAPERHTESRRGRDRRAVNFQHDSGRITFSGPTHQLPLPPGAQDRLSWLVQLPAVLEADPALRDPGREVLLFVAGTRGDAEVWTFEVRGRQTVDTPAGAVAGALHLRRDPRRPYDARVEVWLDPARHHLPVRVHWLPQPGNGAVEMALEYHATP